jgi:type IV pilus assembly protein PilM
MPERPSSLHVLGLDYEGTTIKGALLSRRQGNPVVDHVFEIDILTDIQPDHVKPLYIEDKKAAIHDLTKQYMVSTAIPTNEVLIRPLEMQLKKDKDIDAVLAFQAEPLIPYPVENALLDRVILSKSSEGSNLTLLAVRNDHLQQHLNFWKTHGVDPELISCVPAALVEFSQLFMKKEEPYYIIHLSHSQTICVLAKNGKLIASQMCKKTIGYTTPTKEALDQLLLELTRTLFALAKQLKGEEATEVLLTGECATQHELAESLLVPLNKTAVIPQVPTTISLPIEQLLKFAIPIGIALSGLPGTTDQVNFRQGTFAYPNPWKRLIQPVSFYIGLCIATAAALSIFGNAYIGYLEDGIRQQYAELLMTIKKPYTEMEQDYAAKSPGGKKSSPAIPQPIKTVTMEGLQERLGVLQTEIQSSPDTYPLLPNTPRVSDVLAWLSTHPNVIAPSDQSPLIQIENLIYTLVKRPDLTKKQEKYQAKVEIEFSSPTPKLAREFHDALIAPNTLVDPKGEVKWSTNRGRYKASFFLKDKTIYPDKS